VKKLSSALTVDSDTDKNDSTAQTNRRNSITYLFIYTTVTGIMWFLVKSFFSYLFNDFIATIISIAASNFIMTLYEFIRKRKEIKRIKDLNIQELVTAPDRFRTFAIFFLLFGLTTILSLLYLYPSVSAIYKEITSLVIFILAILILFAGLMLVKVFLFDSISLDEESDDSTIQREESKDQKKEKVVNEQSVNGVLYCTDCGKRVKTADKFCEECGIKFTKVKKNSRKFQSSGRKDHIYFNSPTNTVRRPISPVYHFKRNILPRTLRSRLKTEATQIAVEHGEEWLPGNSSLRTWYANLPVSYKKMSYLVTFELIIPNEFPDTHPVIRVLSPVRHYSIRRGGYVRLPSLLNWSRNDSLSDVMKELKDTVASDTRHLTVEEKGEKFDFDLSESGVSTVDSHRKALNVTDTTGPIDSIIPSTPHVSQSAVDSAINELDTTASSVEPDRTIQKVDKINISLSSNELSKLFERTITTIISNVNKQVFTSEYPEKTNVRSSGIEKGHRRENVSMFTLGEAITTLSDLTMLKLFRQSDYVAILTEIKIVAKALSIRGIEVDAKRILSILNEIQELDINLVEQIKAKTIEWSANIKHSRKDT